MKTNILSSVRCSLYVSMAAMMMWLVMSEKVCKILLVLALMLGVPQA